MREFPYRHPWLFSSLPAVLLGLLPILLPHRNNHHRVVTAVLIFVGVVVVMRWLVSQTPGARERRAQHRG